MKLGKLDQDEFAKFMVVHVLKIVNYNFDVMYDIKKVVDKFNENRANSEDPIFETLNLMIRDTGSDLIDPSDENYKIYEQRSDEVYSLKFCWNYSYFWGDNVFCEVIKLK